ncbi:AbrB/MazE/SpoVT family DNA-binding domain-containing protein [Candidatus Micrarchaeota archaeon]|nr:AbrB/MazE/SpoVT family DNA-binding domain-containing protein [Candidatus Micrarchaeota archaeon]
MYIGSSKVTSKGQLTIPEEIRKKKGLKKGANVVVIDTEAGILIKKMSDLNALFAPFEAIAKKQKLTPRRLAKEITVEKFRTLKAFK